MHWAYDDCKAALDAASRLINTDLAERRNMVLCNPAEGNDYATTKTQVNAYQTILPGEQARSHRHTPHALRVIIEAEGSFSVVNGDKHPMETGDIVLTPGWCWHGHGHDGDAPAYWLDGLDVPLTALLEPMFFEPHPDGFAAVDRVTPDSPYRFTWETIQARLDGAAPDDDGYFGRRIRLEADEMPTIAIYVHPCGWGDRNLVVRQATALLKGLLPGLVGTGAAYIVATCMAVSVCGLLRPSDPADPVMPPVAIGVDYHRRRVGVTV